MNNTVFCVGELLVDFFSTELDTNLIDSQHYEKRAGGAPANVCASVAKLGGHAMFCGKVGNDSFGHFLQQTLEQQGVDTTMLVKDPSYPTTLAFVSRQTGGERDFIFNRGADAYLQVTDINAANFANVKIGHFGSATALLSDPFKTTYIQCMHSLNAQGCFISFDPNFRGDLWKDQVEEFIQWSKTCMILSDFVKVSEDELTLITGIETCEEAIESLHDLGVRVVAVTLGERGTYISVAREAKLISSIKINVVDTTGAGDAFVGATLMKLSKMDEPKNLTLAQYEKIVAFANVSAALVCESVGSIQAIPTVEKIQSYLPQVNG